MKQSIARQRGAVLIWVAISLTTLILLAGLATDTGFVLYTAHQLQNAADASSLAAAQQVRVDLIQARSAAQTYAAANQAARQPILLDANVNNNASGDIVIGQYDREARTFTATLDAPNAVRVNARRTGTSLNGELPLYFGKLAGVESVSVGRYAIAMVGGGTGAGVIALNEDASCALMVRGSSILSVNGGDVQVNSSHATRAACTQNGVIDTPNLNVNGTYHEQGGQADVTGNVNEGAEPIEDPLAFLPNYDYAGLPDYGTINSPGDVQGPGYYSGGISLSGSDTYNLPPGVYVLDGAGLDIQGTVTFIAENVMFYLVGSGTVDLNGTGDIVVTPMESGVYQGVSIFQARDNFNASEIRGTARMELEGALYFPQNHISIGGTGDGFGNQLIADTIEIFGNGEKTIVYDGRFPAAGNEVFLVE